MTRRWKRGALATAWLATGACPAIARAQDESNKSAESTPAPAPPDSPPAEPMLHASGLQLGARLDYAAPLGTLGASTSIQGTHLSDLQSAWVPVGIDVGYRRSPHVYVGGTMLLGPGTDPSSNVVGCNVPGISCSRFEGQVRGELRYYFAPDAQTGGWISGAAGWELGSFSQTAGGATVTSTFTGIAIPDVEIGFDARLRAIAIGPYVGATAVWYLTESVSPSPQPPPRFDSFAAHTWLTLGLRGSYGPW